MFHVELRQFPHNACAFNLSEAELLQTLVIPWSQAQWVSLGERKWNPHQARLTVLEGPHLPVEDLAMDLALVVVPNAIADLGEDGVDGQQEAHLRRLEDSPRPQSGINPGFQEEEGQVDIFAIRSSVSSRTSRPCLRRQG